jgi:hypothetical protein
MAAPLTGFDRKDADPKLNPAFRSYADAVAVQQASGQVHAAVAPPNVGPWIGTRRNNCHDCAASSKRRALPRDRAGLMAARFAC